MANSTRCLFLWKVPLSLIPVSLAWFLAGCASPGPGSEPEVYHPEKSFYYYPLNSPGGKFSGLPPAVQNTVRAQTGSEPIYDVRKEPGPIYKILFIDQELPTLIIAPDGSVLNPDLSVAVPAAHEDIGSYSGGSSSGLKPSELPPPVMKMAQERAPNTEIAFISKEKIGDREIFVISFKDSLHYPTLRIAPDGKIIDEQHH